jgi:predicted short-subunit dehydrogenase-like oxidoreductase (DUF2520 family)
MDIAVIGSGHVAWHLAHAFEERGYSVVSVYSRQLEKAEDLAETLYACNPTDSLDFSLSAAELFILAVSDDAIEEVCRKIHLPEGAILAHTSGAKSIQILEEIIDNERFMPIDYGVFYPLMTFTKGKKVSFSTIPICIEASDEDTEDVLVKLASELSNEVHLISSEQRRVLHVSAVFACNFTNHLWALTKAIVESEDLPFDILKPLIQETVKKAMKAPHPADVQTGPAIRHDQQTILNHLAYLSEDDDLLKVYQLLTESIQDWHQ